MRKAKLLVLMTVAVWLLASSLAHAYLLDQYFGVNPTLSQVTFQYDTGTTTGTYTGYQFTPGSLNPTLHTGTVDAQINDWFGYWDSRIGRYDTYNDGTYPSGEEPYDTEAYYFDDDGTNLYFAIIAGFPSPTTGIYQETRAGIPVTQGDFALDLPGSGGQVDGWDFGYDYGVDLVDENRPASGNVTEFASNTLGNTVYQTTDGWYLGTPNGAVNPTPGDLSNSFTNFDPSYNGGAGMTAVGAATTNWYQLSLPHQENNWNTYVIEITIPRALLPNLRPGDQLQYHWLMGCRNDGNDAVGYMTGSGDIDTPEPGTLALMLTALGPAGMWMRRRRKSSQN